MIVFLFASDCPPPKSNTLVEGYGVGKLGTQSVAHKTCALANPDVVRCSSRLELEYCEYGWEGWSRGERYCEPLILSNVDWSVDLGSWK